MSTFLESSGSWVAIAIVTVAIAVQAASDPIWRGNPAMRAVSLALWLVAPVGAFSTHQFIEPDVIGMKGVLLFGMPWVLIATRARPALLMRDVWPESARQDRALDRLSLRCTTIFLSGVVAAVAAWVTLVLTGTL